jgi:hypothetical protein
LAARAAASIQKEFGFPAETIVGDRGEFTVWLNDQRILAKGFLLPSEKKVLKVVRESLSAVS